MLFASNGFFSFKTWLIHWLRVESCFHSQLKPEPQPAPSRSSCPPLTSQSCTPPPPPITHTHTISSFWVGRFVVVLVLSIEPRVSNIPSVCCSVTHPQPSFPPNILSKWPHLLHCPLPPQPSTGVPRTHWAVIPIPRNSHAPIICSCFVFVAK